MNQLAPDIAAVASLVTALAVLITAWRTNRKIDVKAGQIEEKVAAVQHEVVTANALSLAQLADAAETRRINEKPEAERTPLERSHMDATEGTEV